MSAGPTHDGGTGGAGGGGEAPQGGASAPSGGGKKKALIYGGIAAVLVLIAGVVVAVTVLGGGDDDSAEGEIFLSPAASVGPDPFSTDPLAVAPDPDLAQPATGGDVTVDGSSSITGNDGAEPGLYGGTMNIAACDPQQIIDFLAANPDKAEAWVDALDADPEVALLDGRPLTVELIPDYVEELTSVVLTQDTRVTNHGYKDGKATVLQSTLQKGTAVLVDAKGVPRVKCYCGNPLLPPVASKGKPRYTGVKWADFSVTDVTVVQQSTTVINVFVLTDIENGGLFNRPRGTTGAMDTPTDGSTTTTTAPPTTAGPTTSPPTTAGPTTTAPPDTTTTTAPATTTTGAYDPCAPGGQGQTSVTVTNVDAEPATIVDVTAGCPGGDLGTLSPGQTNTFTTYIGHELDAEFPTGATGNLYIDGPNKSWTVGQP